MAYQYKNPVDSGYTRFKLTKKQHNQFFPRRKMRWHDRYEYYYNDNVILLHKFVNWKGVVLNTILFPILVLLHGVVHVKEIWRELVELFHQKETGSFVSDHAHSGSKTYEDVMKILQPLKRDSHDR